MKKTDISADLKYSKREVLESDKSPQHKFIENRYILINVNSLEIELTNKEVKELKNFVDNVQKYHE